MFQLFDNLDTLSIVDYVLIFAAVSFVIVVISKVMSVTMTFVRLTLKRIKSGPTKDREIEIEDLNIVHEIIAGIYDTLGGHPLNEIVLNDVRSFYNSDTPAPLWTRQVVNIE